MNQGNTKNLGQIAALWVSSNAPENTQLVWYDTREKVHKVYDTVFGHWVALNPQVVTNTTLSALGTIVQGGVELSIGKYYNLVDVGTLAIVISATKIWYVDTHNNYIVNDLSASTISYLNSDNLLIDGTAGVWDENTGRLLINFAEYSSGEEMDADNDYAVFRRKNGSVWSWIKVKLRALISSVLGNSITWNKGIYFNFASELDNVKDVRGGVVSYGEYVEGLNDVFGTISDVEESVFAAEQASKDYADSEVTPAKIYGKKPGEIWTILNNPPSIPGQDATMRDIFQILISWTNILQKADKTFLGNGFNSEGRIGNVNYTDSVRAAIEKLVYKTKQLIVSNGMVLPSDFNYNNYPQTLPVANDTMTTAIGKICSILKDVTRNAWSLTVDDDWMAEETLGEQIGKYDGSTPTSTAYLYNIICLLCSWYDEHFNSNYRAYNDWSVVDLWYREDQGGATPAYQRRIGGIKYKICENSIILWNPTPFSYIVQFDPGTAFGEEEFFSNIEFDLHEELVLPLRKKFSFNGVDVVPFNLNIPILIHNVVTNPGVSLVKYATGTLYGGVGQHDAAHDNTSLQMVPFVQVTSSGLCNINQTFGTKWLGDLGTAFDTEERNTCAIKIPQFTIEIPLY